MKSELSGKIKNFVREPLFPPREKDNRLPKLSIVAPVYNSARFLERSILSVLNQNYPNLEFIIIDGGSTDNSLEIIKRYESRFDHWVSEGDNGQSHALNKGFSLATGDIFGWLNGDDLYAPGAFETAVELFSKNRHKGIVFGDYLCIDSDEAIISPEFAFDFNLNHFIYEGFHMNAQSMFWRREAHRRFGAFNEELKRTMDYDMILRFGLNEGEKGFLRTENILGCFRRHQDQKTRGVDEVVIGEHLLIARTNRLQNKHKRVGKLFRFLFRLRRLFWYLKRGGFSYAFEKTFKTFGLTN